MFFLLFLFSSFRFFLLPFFSFSLFFLFSLLFYFPFFFARRMDGSLGGYEKAQLQDIPHTCVLGGHTTQGHDMGIAWLLKFLKDRRIYNSMAEASWCTGREIHIETFKLAVETPWTVQRSLDRSLGGYEKAQLPNRSHIMYKEVIPPKHVPGCRNSPRIEEFTTPWQRRTCSCPAW